jgi:CBS domain containing-hemolysin-like protein
MTGSAWPWVALLLVGVCGSAMCSGIETGAYCVNRLRLNVRANASRPDRAARRLLREISDPERLLASILISNNTFNYLGSLGVAGLLARAGIADWANVLVNVLVLTPTLLIFGEVLPKDLFRAEADRLTYRLSWAFPALRWATTATLLLPAVRVYARLVARVVGQRGSVAVSGRAEVAALLKEGVRHGVLSETQTTLMDRALALRDARVGDVMTPWRLVVSVGSEWDAARVRAALRAASRSRIPVVDTRGRVVGAIARAEGLARQGASVAELRRDIKGVDASAGVDDALLTLRDDPGGAAIVEDRGRPVGLVTNEDLLGLLIG